MERSSPLRSDPDLRSQANAESGDSSQVNWRVEAGGLIRPARLTPSHFQGLSAGTTAAQKSSLRPVEPLTIPRSSRNTSSEGSDGVPP
jgi:hypothetical protein